VTARAKAKHRSVVTTARVLRIAERTMSRPTAPYREGAVIAWVRDFAARNPQLVLRSDPSGNLELRRRGVRATAAPLVLGAHMDHPGFRALRSKRLPGRRGFAVDALFLGGVRREYFPGARARFYVGEGDVPATTVPARIVRAAPDPKSGELRVRLEAHAAVPAGSWGVWELPDFRRSRRNPDLLESRAADDLAGVAAILAVLEVVDCIDPARRVDVRGLFTRAEEVGFVGAIAAARCGRLPAGARIVAIEASKALPHAPQGAGPILRVGDRTSIFDDGLTRWLSRVATDLAGPIHAAGSAATGNRFAWQRRLMDGGTCESTAYQLYGYRCAALCVPLGNYHNMSERGRIAVESIRLSDLVGLVRFFEGMIQRDSDCPRAGAPDPLRLRLEKRYERGARDLARDPFS
jgi:endoglucanase